MPSITKYVNAQALSRTVPLRNVYRYVNKILSGECVNITQ